MYLGFLVNKASKLERELESAANIELKKSKENQLRLLYYSAKSILDSPFVVTEELYLSYKYVMQENKPR